ncbi:MAG: flagellar motor switch protein FliG [Spirochaetales bacterium]|nr:flagellar motor switch protein FliG [Spirochaetales bacterium]
MKKKAGSKKPVDSGKKDIMEDNRTKETLLKVNNKDKGYRKAAEFLVLLGREEAAKVLQHLSEEEALGIAREISNLENIDQTQAKKLLEEFGYLLKTRDLVAKGGLDKAREMLVTAFGEEKGDAFFAKIAEKTIPHPFSFLNDLPEEQVKTVLKDESPAVISVILPHIDPALASKLLNTYLPEEQKNIVMRIAKMQSISPEVLQRIEEILKERVRKIGEAVSQIVDGKNALIEILRNMNTDQSQTILSELSANNPELADEIGGKLFTIDVIYKIRDRDLQRILHEFTDKDLAILLKGKEKSVLHKILSCVSGRRAELIQMESQAIGKILKTEADRATDEFLDQIKRHIETGRIVIIENGEEMVE